MYMFPLEINNWGPTTQSSKQFSIDVFASHAGCEDALHLLVDRSMRVAETALHSYRSQHKAAGDKAALLLQAVKLLSLLSKCAMPNGGDVSALFEEHMRNAANRRYRLLKTELHPPALGDACIQT